MQRWLSGLRRTIGNRVTANPVRRFKSSSLRQKGRKLNTYALIFKLKKQ